MHKEILTKEQISKTDFRKILEKEFQWTFEDPRFSEADIPAPNPKNIAEDNLSYLGLKDFLLSTYIIKDQFDKNHDACRAFEAKLEGKHEGMMDRLDSHSKLGTNVLRRPLIAINNIIEEVKDKNPYVYSALLVAKGDFQDYRPEKRYQDMEFNEKVEYAKSIDRFIIKVMQILTRRG